MGIRHLNKYLHDKCSKKAISKIHMHKLSGKTVVIDTSIYLYQFLSEDALLENMYLFISILQFHNITPIFIFDGKPPPEKRELLRQRHSDKRTAYEKYLKMQAELENANLTGVDRNKMVSEMEYLKRQCIRIYDEDIVKVKRLMDAYSVTHYDAPGEADDLCAYFVTSGRAWACISDDMDMFLYKCPYVIRNISLMNQTVMLYDKQTILQELGMSEKDFCEILILSGTDYNSNTNTSLYETINWYNEYCKYKLTNTINDKPLQEFYIWLLKNTKYITDYRKVIHVYTLFQGRKFAEYDGLNFTPKPNTTRDLDAIHNLMKEEGFIFT
jgi:hypothetical protein